MTQLESLVSSLQAILNDQTFAMHDLRSQLSEFVSYLYSKFSFVLKFYNLKKKNVLYFFSIQVVLKKMQDKQETISSEEIMKQVVTMKV